STHHFDESRVAPLNSSANTVCHPEGAGATVVGGGGGGGASVAVGATVVGGAVVVIGASVVVGAAVVVGASVVVGATVVVGASVVVGATVGETCAATAPLTSVRFAPAWRTHLEWYESAAEAVTPSSPTASAHSIARSTGRVAT